MKKIISLILVLVMVLSLAACGSKAAPEKTEGNAAANEVKIGVVLPLTGSSAEMGNLAKNGIDLAIDTINAQGGIKSLNGAKIVPTYTDSTGKPEVGVTEIERLIVKDKVNAILGPYNSNVAAPTAEVAEKYSMPYMLTNAVADDILKKDYKYVFRANQSSSGNAIDLIGFLNDIGKKTGTPVKSIALVYESTDWGSSSAAALQKVAEEAGIKVVASLDYPANTADMTSIIVKLKEINPEVVIPMSYLNDALLFTNTAAEMKLNSAILAGGGGFSAPAFVEKAGKAAEYVMTLSGWDPDILSSKTEASKKLNDEYKARFGTNFSEYSANAWMSAMVLFDAIERAGSIEANAIKDALSATDLKADNNALLLHPYEGMKFNEDVRGMMNQNKYSRQIIVQVKDGKYRMVWPFEMAPKDAELTWPVPAWDAR